MDRLNRFKVTLKEYTKTILILLLVLGGPCFLVFFPCILSWILSRTLEPLLHLGWSPDYEWSWIASGIELAFLIPITIKGFNDDFHGRHADCDCQGCDGCQRQQRQKEREE